MRTGDARSTLEGANRPRRTFWIEAPAFDWTALTNGRQARTLSQGSTLFEQGDPVRSIFVISRGRVRLATYSDEGKERHLMVIGPGGLVGDWGVADRGSHLTAAVASVDTTVYEVPAAGFLRALQAEPELLAQAMAFAEQRIQALLQHHDLLSAGPAVKRVALALTGLAHAHGVPHPRGVRLQVRFTQAEMASICSLSRMSVSTVLKDLFSRGLLLRDGRWLVIAEPGKIDALIGSPDR
ncbi:hypothetical protein RD110_22715 [Rhodoferax koreense]|uniref:Crp/Fnr family transcriptional regulator n=1 Tax=Rhodoferax koreensis TaxID=1842727 RepID=A0A1P8K0Z1_9BURK|nr:Crp/Fnr family transcriptional regulator [Rhodoferax koreense]APW39669.1 hypothetical protein RD110_22715 [Rhodoferax koreense]